MQTRLFTRPLLDLEKIRNLARRYLRQKSKSI